MKRILIHCLALGLIAYPLVTFAQVRDADMDNDEPVVAPSSSTDEPTTTTDSGVDLMSQAQTTADAAAMTPDTAAQAVESPQAGTPESVETTTEATQSTTNGDTPVQATEPAAEKTAPQQAASPVPEAKPEPAIAIVDQAPTAPALTMDNETLSVDFPDEDIRNILRNVADLYELNIVLPDALQGRTSIKLRDVTWRQIFSEVLTPVGYTFVEDGNIIRIVSQAVLEKEPVNTEVFLINYATAKDITNVINPLVDPSQGGKVVVDARTNALIVTERPSRLSKIRPIIEKLDKATAQVMIETKFVEVTNRDVKNIGINWASLSGYKAGGGQLQRSFQHSNDSSNTNQTNTQTNGSSTVASTVTATSTDLVSGNFTGSSSTNVTSTPASTAVTELNNLLTAEATSRLTTAVFSADDFNIILSALKTQNETKLVSNPTVVTLNNTEAFINIGEEYPIPKYTYNKEQAVFEVSGFEYRPIGIILKVTPQVNSQGFIKLNLEPEVSSRNGTANFGTAEIPIISTRKSKTQVSLKDGYTMGIGGLIENTVTNGETKVPVLGSIPLIGNLFKSKSTNDDERNLLIFITAKTVNPEGATVSEVFDPRVIRSMNLKKEDLPGYREEGDPFTEKPSVTESNGQPEVQQ